MNLKCILGFHRWNGCRCSACTKTRDENHQWSEDCEKCSACGKTRSLIHKWIGCKCIVCYKKRDEGHKWGEDCEKCSTCGKIMSMSHRWSGCKCNECGKIRDQNHQWDGCKCLKCGTTRDLEHNWTYNCVFKRCSRCGTTRDDGHDWSENCNMCKTCGFTPEYQIKISKKYSTLEIILPRVEVTGSHLPTCEKAARTILPRLCSFKGARVRIKVPYTSINEAGSYYIEPSIASFHNDNAGWHHYSGGDKTHGCEIFDPRSLGAEWAVLDDTWRSESTIISKITDQAILAKIVFEDDDEFRRQEAIIKLTDQAVLAEVALANDGNLSTMALKRLMDQEVLATVALDSNTSSTYRLAAIENLTNEAVLIKVLFEDKESKVRRAVFRKLYGKADQEFLTKVAVEGRDAENRIDAIQRLMDQEILTKLNTGWNAVSDAAAARLKELSVR